MEKIDSVASSQWLSNIVLVRKISFCTGGLVSQMLLEHYVYMIHRLSIRLEDGRRIQTFGVSCMKGDDREGMPWVRGFSLLGHITKRWRLWIKKYQKQPAHQEM